MIIDGNDDDEETMKEMFEIVQFLESQEEYMNAAVTEVLTSGSLRTVRFTRDRIDFDRHVEQLLIENSFDRYY
jgi:hypothetical protein